MFSSCGAGNIPNINLAGAGRLLLKNRRTKKVMEILKLDHIARLKPATKDSEAAKEASSKLSAENTRQGDRRMHIA